MNIYVSLIYGSKRQNYFLCNNQLSVPPHNDMTPTQVMKQSVHIMLTQTILISKQL